MAKASKMIFSLELHSIWLQQYAHKSFATHIIHEMNLGADVLETRVSCQNLEYREFRNQVIRLSDLVISFGCQTHP